MDTMVPLLLIPTSYQRVLRVRLLSLATPFSTGWLWYTEYMSQAAFEKAMEQATVVPIVRRIMGDHLTPVLAYRRLVAKDNREAPSFLFESVENGDEVGRFSFLGANPVLEITAKENLVSICDHETGKIEEVVAENPLDVVRQKSSHWNVSEPIAVDDLPLPSFLGGWVGYAGYDTARYFELDVLPFKNAPLDDRELPDVHFSLYKTIVIFDHVSKVVHVVHNAIGTETDQEMLWNHSCKEIDDVVELLQCATPEIPVGSVELDLSTPPPLPAHSTMSQSEFECAVDRCKAYIREGDAFQIVISQRFEHRTTIDPFEIYRSLRVVNPSPYMIYVQGGGCILAASSPEILCRCKDGLVTNRPLAGTRKRGNTVDEDLAVEDELKNDEKECSEHVMLVDLGRNDLGTVCEIGSVEIESVMDIERYSHVMHLSSTLTGTLADGKDSWDALAATLPVGTVSGAPKIRSMQIIDELEPTRRGPYAGGIGMVSFAGDMDIAIALRTMVVPLKMRNSSGWRIDVQAGAGVVIDSQPELEWKETRNKAAALGRAIELAESSFGSS
ncbi:MAG: anthranilate synthase component I [Phycisphaerales bacterium]|nr:anthranilate synthase component I [Phycisphaerales bacterium]